MYTETNTESLSVDQALEYIEKNIDCGQKKDINGDIFFGLGTAYAWEDVACAAGLTPNATSPQNVPMLRRKSFRTFRNKEELRRCLEWCLRDSGGLYAGECEFYNI